jgi:site-specific DNA-cytosine methylase
MKKRRPPVILIENVTGFLTSHGGDDFKEALLALNRLGYGVDAFILDAARFTPQSRQSRHIPKSHGTYALCLRRLRPRSGWKKF